MHRLYWRAEMTMLLVQKYPLSYNILFLLAPWWRPELHVVFKKKLWETITKYYPKVLEGQPGQPSDYGVWLTFVRSEFGS